MAIERPSRPSPQIFGANGLTEDMWAVMEDCWKGIPSERPTSTQIVETIFAFPSAKADEPMTSDWEMELTSRPSYFLADVPLTDMLVDTDQELIEC